MSRKFYYLRDDQVRKVVAMWWARLQGIDRKEAAPQQANQRGARAELRRSKSLDAVLLTEGFRNLWQALAETVSASTALLLAMVCFADPHWQAQKSPLHSEASWMNRPLADLVVDASPFHSASL